MLNELKKLLYQERLKIRETRGENLSALHLELRLYLRLSAHAWNFLLSRFYLRRASKLRGIILTKGRPSIENKGYMEIGHLVRIWSTVFRSRLAVKQGGYLIIGNNCRINGATIAVTQRVEVGNNCRLAPFCHIMDGDFHDLQDRQEEGKSAPVIIEDGAWLGTRTMVLKGVRVGQGAVVASGAVVTKDVAPYTMVGGVPARFIKQLR